MADDATKIKALKLMVATALFLVVVVSILAVSFAFRFENIKTDCNQKLESLRNNNFIQTTYVAGLNLTLSEVDVNGSR